MAKIGSMAATASEIHGELLLDIFSRLPDTIDLLRCAATCGPWFRVILAATAAGHLNLPQLRRSSFVLGAFYQNAVFFDSGPAPDEKPSCCPPRFVRIGAPSQPGGSFPSFLPNPDGLFSYAMPLASRRGLLLSRLMPPMPADHRRIHLAVSHPLLAGRARLLPPPPVDLNLTGYALLPDADDPGEFRVLIIVSGSGGHHDHRAYSYSSATGLWSAPTKCPMTGGLAMSGPRAGTVDAHGTAHWLYRDNNSSFYYTLAITGNSQAHASLTKLPFILHGGQRGRFQLQQPLSPCLTGDGDLALVHNRRPDAADGGERGALDLWINKAGGDHGGSGWARRPKELAKYKAAPLESLKVLGFAESAGKLLVRSVGTMLSWLDVESGATEMASSRHYPREVCRSGRCQGFDSCRECTYNCRMLYEVHWASFLRQISAWS